MNDFIDQCSIPFILVHLRPSYDVSNVHLLPIGQYLLFSSHAHGWLVGFVALRPKSTAMVIAGRPVHLTTLFPGQA